MKAEIFITFIFFLFLSSFCFGLDSLEVVMTFALPDSQEIGLTNPNKEGSDLNNDGYDDFVYIEYVNSYFLPYKHLFYWGSPNPDPIPDLDLLGPWASGLPSWGGDLNRDGYNDIVYSVHAGWGDGGDIYICLGGDSIDIEPELLLHGEDYAPDPCNLGFTGINGGYDFNGDGYKDILAGGTGPDYFFNGQVDLFFGGEEIDDIPDFHIQGAALDFFGEYKTAGDVNGDGYDDLIASRGIEPYEGPQKFEIYLGGPDMNTVMDYEIPGEFMYSGIICNGDINNDGFDDLIIRNYGIYFGNPSGELSMDIPLYESGLCALFYCKVNNDEYSDVVAKVSGHDTIYVFYGSEDFDLEPDIILPLSSGSGCNLGDFNGDGKDEIIFKTGYNTATVYTLATQSIDDNDGSGIVDHSIINAYPNPFTDHINICFSSRNSSNIHLEIYNIKGQRVRTLINNQTKEGGYYEVIWDGRDDNGHCLGSGIYFIKLRTEKGVNLAKMVKIGYYSP